MSIPSAAISPSGPLLADIEATPQLFQNQLATDLDELHRSVATVADQANTATGGDVEDLQASVDALEIQVTQLQADMATVTGGLAIDHSIYAQTGANETITGSWTFLKTTDQLRLAYDGANYVDMLVNGSGVFTLDLSGANTLTFPSLTGTLGLNMYRKAVVASIGDPQTFAQNGQPFFWEDRSGAGKGDKLHVAVYDGSAWAWEPWLMFGGI